MPKLFAFSLLPLVCLSTIFGEQAPRKNTAPASAGAQQAIAKAKLSIVRVEADGEGIHPSGTGFIVDNSGAVVTALHVVKPMGHELLGKIYISVPIVSKATSTGQQSGNWVGLPANPVEMDKDNDIAIVRLSSGDIFNDKSFPTAVNVPGLTASLSARKPMPLSLKLLNDGDKVFVSGLPLSESQVTTTSGAVASEDKELLRSDNPAVHARYTLDLRVNHGNSGGPAYVANGSVVGMVDEVLLASVEEHPDEQYNSGLAVIVPSKYIQRLLRKAQAPVQTALGKSH